MILSLLLVYPLLLLPSLALSSQTPLAPPPSQADYPPPAILTSTLVDVLSSDPEYSSLLRLLQRTRLIPTLNKLGNATLFAPTNDALARARSDPSSSLHHLFPLSSSSSPSSEDGDDDHTSTPFLDNVLFPLRQTLLYHILNFTLPSTSSPLFPSSGQPHSFETLLFPHSFSRNTTNNTAPAPPWLPAREGLLGGDGQRVRAFLSAQGEGEEKQQAKLGVDWDGKGGWSVLGEPIVAGNGVVVKLDGVLEMPKDVGSTILAHPSLSYLSSLLLPASSIPPMPVPPKTYLSSLQTLANLTLFAPSNAAWAKLAPIERTYLESGFAGDDIELLVKLHAANDGVRVRKDGGAASAVGWRESFGEKGKGEIEMVGGGKVWIEVGKEGEMSVGLKGAGGDEDEGDKENEEDKEGAVQVVEPDILCENGVVHIIDDLLIPRGAFRLTAEKTLIGLNATKFITLLRSVNLTSYVDASSSNEAYTILAPIDDLPSFLSTSPLAPNPASRANRSPFASLFPPSSALSSDHLPPAGSEKLADLLRYHILPGRLRVGDLVEGGLVGTEMRLESLRGGRQVLRVSVKKAAQGLGIGNVIPVSSEGVAGEDEGDDDDGEREDWEEVRFGEVDVVAEPIEIGRSIIYLLSSFLTPPSDLITTSVSDLHLSTFIASIFSSSLDHELKSTPGTTTFIPRNKAFSSLGMVMNYLLLPEAKAELKSVVRGHVVEEVIYLDDLRSGKGGKRREVETLEGCRVSVGWEPAEGRSGASGNGSVVVGGQRRESDGQKLNGEIRDARVEVGDMLTSNGVVHQIDQVILPPSLNITLAKLLRGSKSTTIMPDLLARANLTWLLSGTEPTVKDLEPLGLAGFDTDLFSSSSLLPARRKSPSSNSSHPHSLPLPSFTLLCPTDAAFSTLNLTYYLSSSSALLSLLSQHILPSLPPLPLPQTITSSGSSTSLAKPAMLGVPTDGRPLKLEEEVGYLTLLSARSRWGDLAFRKGAGRGEVAGGYLVGIKGAKGVEDELNDFARVLGSGRATPHWPSSSLLSSPPPSSSDPTLLLNGVAPGGGVIVIDTVLVPFRPSWMQLYGWTVLLVGLGVVAALSLLAVVGIWLWSKRERRGVDYEPLDNEED